MESRTLAVRSGPSHAAGGCARRATLALAISLAAFACGTGDPPAAASNPGAAAPDAAPAPEPSPEAPPTDAGADAAPGGCTRADQARTASTALFDAFQAELAGLTGAARASRADKLVADVLAAGGTPLELPAGDRVVFLAKGAPPSGPWAVTTSRVGFDPAKATPLAAIDGTDLWAAELSVPRGERFEYKLLSGAAFLEDPLARNVTWDGLDRGTVGEFNAVGHAAATPMSEGRLVAWGRLPATKLGASRAVYAYFPPRYDDGTCAKLPSIVFHDGNESLTRGDFAGAADALYAKRPELSAVLVFVALPSQDVRMDEYSFGTATAKGPDYVDFLASDLWPTMTKRARLCGAAAARGISGASLGGLISTFAAFEKPTEWGWVGAQSGSYFWENDAMIARAASTPKIPVRFYLDSGCPNDNCVVTDAMHATLQQKGYDVVRIKEDGAAHAWSYWNGRLGGLLTHFREGQTVCD